VRIGFFGGLQVEANGAPVSVSGSMQRAALFRLALDAGTTVSYRALTEDLWPDSPPENERAALQSLVSRLRSQLPVDSIDSEPGGYRLGATRTDVDLLRFQDLVASATRASSRESATELATEALALWTAEPWLPDGSYDWLRAHLAEDRVKALELGGSFHLDTVATLPAPMTSLIGRADELRTVASQLDANRLVTIIGVGGVGKTRLAVEAASARPRTVFVELASVGPDELWQAILGAVGRDVRQVDGSTESGLVSERTISTLSGRDILLVLDNCEHLVAAAALACEELLKRLPRLRILTTSREPMGILGEAFVALGPLQHPSRTEIARGLGADDWRRYPALELFRQRALAASGVDLTDDEIGVAARITLRLDGLALALELAAARLRTMTLEEVADGLDDRFALLGGGLRTALPRHQTLRALIDWSWGMLDADERAALTGIAVYPSGIRADAASEVAASMGLASPSAFDSLVDKSLLQRANGRYRSLETIREYGIERLAESGTIADARSRQATHMSAATAMYDTQLRSASALDAVEWFDSEEDNIAAALRFAVENEQGDVAARLVAANCWYWAMRDRFAEAATWSVAVAPLIDGQDFDEARLVLLIDRIASAFAAHPEMDPSLDHLPEQFREFVGVSSLAAKRGGPVLLQVAPHLLEAFLTASQGGSWLNAIRVPRGEDLDLDPWPTALLHVVRAALAENDGEIEEFGDASELALSHFEEIGDVWGLALARQLRANWLVLAGELDAAFELTELSTSGMRRITSSADLAQQQGLAVSILVRQGKFDEARERLAVLFDEAEQGGIRSLVQVQLTASIVDAAVGDFEALRARVAQVDELAPEWERMPLQIVAMNEAVRAGVAIADSRLEDAEASLRDAADAAIASRDHPIMSYVALGLGSLAIARGELGDARRALELATSLRGVFDRTEPQVQAICAALVAAGESIETLERASTEMLARPQAVAALGQILRR
jgi:predicted ATPase